jgi:hypothetical protein
MKLTEVFAKPTYRKRIPRLPNETYKQLPKVGQWVALLMAFREGDYKLVNEPPYILTGQVTERDDNQIHLEVYCDDIMEENVHRKDIHRWIEIGEITDCDDNWEDYMKMFNLNPDSYAPDLVPIAPGWTRHDIRRPGN